MSQNKGGRKNRGSRFNKKINIGDMGKENLENINENSLVVQQFRAYASELNDRYERYERIVKLGRDITIESKKLIFSLHTVDKISNVDKTLQEAKIINYFKSIALELENQDAYHYLRAYRPGLEEYIEALTFNQYLKNGNIENWTELEKILTHTISEESNDRTLITLFTPYEYILGIADLTGELMRKCINNLATGEIASCFETCNFVRNVYKGFLGCTNMSNKEMNRKLCTLRQSLQKMENVCYTIKVRGSEIPKHILVDVATEEDDESDEGYQPY